jgi:hypothetical protein
MRRQSAVLFAALLACILGALLSAKVSPAATKLSPAVRVAAGPPPRISLWLPKQAAGEAPVVARGRVRFSALPAGVLIEVRSSHGWRRLAHAKARNTTFRVAFVLPRKINEPRIRAVLVQGRRRLATSQVRVVRLPANQSAAPAGRAYWGAWIGSQLTGTAAPFDMSAASKFAQMTGKPPSMLEFASPFADCSTSQCAYYEFPTPYMDAIRATGAIPFLSWSSASTPGGATQPDFQLSDLIGGAYDQYIRQFATEAAAWGHPFFLRFDWEMNGDWFPWGEVVNGNNPGEFATAWRHVHDIFTSVGANNATWVWCPYANRTNYFASQYPGDQYVDWTCLDAYNWGTNPALPRTWKSFDELFGEAYDQIIETVAPDKPMLIGETASSEWGGSKATWIQGMFESLPTKFPQIRGLLWFEGIANGMDWPLESSESALSAFSAGIGDSRYVGNTAGGIATSPLPPP